MRCRCEAYKMINDICIDCTSFLEDKRRIYKVLINFWYDKNNVLRCVIAQIN